MPKPLLSKFPEVFGQRFQKIFYKTNFDGEPVELCFLTVKASKEGVTQPEIGSSPRGIKTNRKRGIINKRNRLRYEY